MEELLVLILQFLFEFVLNVLGNLPFDWPSRNRATPERERIAAVCALWFAGGCVLAGISLLIFPRSLVPTPALRMLNLLLAPVAAAFLSQAIARRRARRNPNIVPRNHFWQAFWYTSGLTLIRFMYTTRP